VPDVETTVEHVAATPAEVTTTIEQPGNYIVVRLAGREVHRYLHPPTSPPADLQLLMRQQAADLHEWALDGLAEMLGEFLHSGRSSAAQRAQRERARD
jgi:hypothetical protein